MSCKIEPPEHYLESLRRKIQWRKDNWGVNPKHMENWRLSIDKMKNRHVDSDGYSWGWYEISPLGIEVGYWSKTRDDLSGFDIAGWNKKAKDLKP